MATPACEGQPIPWDDESRLQAKELVRRSLDAASSENPLGVADAATELHAEGQTYFVLVPDGVAVPRIPGLIRVDVRPTPDGDQLDTPVWSQQIEIIDRYRGGFSFRTEEHSAFADGPTARLVNVYCGAFVDGDPVVVHLQGVAS